MTSNAGKKIKRYLEVKEQMILKRTRLFIVRIGTAH